MATSNASARRQPPPPGLPPLQGGELVLGTIALSLATFMNARQLDREHMPGDLR
jgi:hypothetical protein